MSCADLAELISAYADGQTVPAQTEFVEAHLAVCSRCQDTLRRHQQTRRLLRLAGDDTWVPPDLGLRVVHAYRRRHGGGLAGRGTLAACVALLLAVVLGAQMLAMHGTGPALTAAGSPPVVVRPSVVAAAPVRVAQAPSAASSRCRGLPQHNMATCLGVSPYWLRTVLAQEISLGASSHGPAVRPLYAAGQRAGAPPAGQPAWKGGGARRLIRSTHIGPQPI